MSEPTLPAAATAPKPANSTATTTGPVRFMHGLALLLGLLLAAFAAVFGWQSWVAARAEHVEQLGNVLAVVNVAIDRYLLEMEAGVADLAAGLLDAQGQPVDARLAQPLLARFQKAHPGLVSVSLRQLDGGLIASALPMAAAPTATQGSFGAFRADIARHTGLSLGQPVANKISGYWMVPLRYVLRDARGAPVAVVIAGLPTEFLQSFWQSAPIVERASIGLLGDDGFLRGRYPVPARVPAEETYGKMRGGALRQHLLAKNFPDRGYVEGYNQLGGEVFGNAYARLPHFKATLFVALPTSEFTLAWWRRIEVPLVLMLLFSAGGGLVYRATLRRQQRWSRERREAEATLERSEGRYRRLFESSMDAVILTREDGRLLGANPAASAMFGHSQQALREGGLAALLDPADPRVAALLAARARHGQAQGAATALRADGTRFEAELSTTTYLDVAGEPLASLVLRDASPQQQAERALREKALAEQASGAKSAFIARMSHELRTPLNAILGFSEVMQLDTRQPLAPAQRDRLAHVRRSGAHLLALINDVLDLSRIEAGSLKVQWQDVDLQAIVDEAVHEVAGSAEAQGVALEWQAQGGPPQPIRGDRTRVLQVVLNLLSNAIKYNRAGGRVEISLLARDRHVRLTVRDTGIGMSPAQLEALFQPFNRLGREATGVEGTGIGLVIARSLVDLMGGSVAVSSSPGQGSTFSVDWQAANHAAPLLAALPEREARPLASDEITGTVLYIDDDEVNRLLMQAFLALRPRLALHLAEDGAQGLALAQQQRPSLVLVDLMMPGMSGAEVLTALRATPGLADVPCIAVSANAMPEEIAQTLAAGFDGYLTKPLAAAVLLAEVDRRLAPAAALSG